MDELKMIKDFRRPAREMPTTVENSVREGLTALATEEAERARPARPRRIGRRAVLRLGLAASLTVAVGAGLTVVQDFRGEEHQVASAAEFGDRAARAVENGPYRPPGPHQWVYIKFVTAGGFDMNTWWNGVDLKSNETIERWTRVDGKADAEMRDGKLEVHSEDDDVNVRRSGGPMFNLSNYHTLPTDPDALLKRLYSSRYPNQIGPTDAGSVFQSLTGMVDDPLPPKLRAAIYRALPKIPGVKLRRGVSDQAGRVGDAFSLVDDLGERTSIMLDPATYEYLGTRTDVARDRPVDAKPSPGFDPGPRTNATARAGTVLGSYAYLAVKIVDKPGQRS